MDTQVISKPIYQILSDLTQEPRLEVALPLAIKDWLRLKLKEARDIQGDFRERYGKDFQAFQRAWESGEIPKRHSYEVERDYWEWEAAVTDEIQVTQMLESLP
jgi:hypothetical protein